MTRYITLPEYFWLAEPVTGNEAAVLTCRLAWNHPLPDANKRAAWASS